MRTTITYHGYFMLKWRQRFFMISPVVHAFLEDRGFRFGDKVTLSTRKVKGWHALKRGERLSSIDWEYGGMLLCSRGLRTVFRRLPMTIYVKPKELK